MRVNARLDEARAAKLAELQALTEQSASDVLKQAIDCLHKERTADARKRLDGLLSSDFVGCVEGPPDLAEDYKRHLTDSLSDKHGAG